MKNLNLIKNDSWLEPFEKIIYQRLVKAQKKEVELTGGNQSLSDFASGYLFFGLHRTPGGWIIREWAPNATNIYLIGDFNNWEKSDSWAFTQGKNGVWELKMPADAIHHGDFFKLLIT